MSDLTSLSDVDLGSLSQRESTAFPVAEITEDLVTATRLPQQKNRNQGHEHFGVE